jgi:4-hydroxybenzoate polyprenyltransferase
MSNKKLGLRDVWFGFYAPFCVVALLAWDGLKKICRIAKDALELIVAFLAVWFIAGGTMLWNAIFHHDSPEDKPPTSNSTPNQPAGTNSTQQ